ncbi:MAG: 50S ribosomal protein L25 [Limnochordia bacterium]|jgi:large subunit ribosomal protein L25|nr:50S ribosomal protein L25 [Limnochordia bacterium]MDD2629119.1 50S ribosomal protein L25 [Limnochordia bacterium]MDD4517825.1 50S ribosomal protein L25 [Limnochordia bacterium]
MVGVVLTAQTRAKTGKGASRQFRRMGRVPGIIYGKGKENMMVTLDNGEFNRFLADTGVGQLVNLEVSVDDQVQSRPSLLKEVQVDPVRGDVVHVDFHEVALDEEIKTSVEIVLVDEGTGITGDGGIISHILREVEIECLPTQIPDQVNVSVAGLSIGDIITVADLDELSGAKYVTDLDETVVTVVAPSQEEVEDEDVEDEEDEDVEEADAAEGVEAAEDDETEE